MEELKGYLSDRNGNEYRLPRLLSWTLTHGRGKPCDAFELACVFTAEMWAPLRACHRFRAEYGGETAFKGVIDELRADEDGSGRTLSVSGRGMGALLMDNEAEAAVYARIDTATMLSNHVKPFGITDISYKELGAISNFSIDSGTCQWNALYKYCRYAAGITPRFSRAGRLMLGTYEPKEWELGEKLPLLELSRRDRRYGVVSEVLVNNKAQGSSRAVRDEAFIARGGCCRRVLSVPRDTGRDAMRYTGEYQLAEANADAEAIYAVLPGVHFPEPGDIVTIYRPAMGINEKRSVDEREISCGAAGARTRLKLV